MKNKHKVEEEEVVVQNGSSVWEIGNDCITDGKCPHIRDNNKHAVLLSEEVEMKIKYLCRKFPSTEWIAFLSGEQQETTDGNISYIAENLTIFDQENTSAHTELTMEGNKQLAEWKRNNNCIGWIHSHCHMRVMQSPDDEDTACMYPVSITTNNDFEFYCTIKALLPCGKEALFISTVYVNKVITNDKDFEDSVAILIREKPYNTQNKKSKKNKWNKDNWKDDDYDYKEEELDDDYKYIDNSQVE